MQRTHEAAFGPTSTSVLYKTGSIHQRDPATPPTKKLKPTFFGESDALRVIWELVAKSLLPRQALSLMLVNRAFSVLFSSGEIKKIQTLLIWQSLRDKTKLNEGNLTPEQRFKDSLSTAYADSFLPIDEFKIESTQLVFQCAHEILLEDRYNLCLTECGNLYWMLKWYVQYVKPLAERAQWYVHMLLAKCGFPSVLEATKINVASNTISAYEKFHAYYTLEQSSNILTTTISSEENHEQIEIAQTTYMLTRKNFWEQMSAHIIAMTEETDAAKFENSIEAPFKMMFHHEDKALFNFFLRSEHELSTEIFQKAKHCLYVNSFENSICRDLWAESSVAHQLDRMVSQYRFFLDEVDEMNTTLDAIVYYLMLTINPDFQQRGEYILSKVGNRLISTLNKLKEFSASSHRIDLCTAALTVMNTASTKQMISPDESSRLQKHLTREDLSTEDQILLQHLLSTIAQQSFAK